MLSDYELMASEPEDGGSESSPPSSPFSLVSSAHTTEAPSDLDLASDDDMSAEDMDALDIHSVNGSDHDWAFVQRHDNDLAPGPPSMFSSNPVASSSSISSSSRTPSPQPIQTSSFMAYSPPATPRPRSPQLLQLPISDPTAQPFTLVRLLNLPQYQTLEDLVNLLTKSASMLGSAFHYSDRIPVPLWVSFRPALSAMESGDPGRSSALIRFMNPEDAACLSEMFERMKSQLVQMEEAGEFWYWLLDLDVVLLSDEEAEKGEEGRGLLWVADWLRNDDESSAQRPVKAASDLITTILMTPLPSDIRLRNLIDLFVNMVADDSPKPIRIALLPDLAAHTIFLSCCILQYADAVTASRAMAILSNCDNLLFEPYSGSDGGARCFLDMASATGTTRKSRVEFKPGDWWSYTSSIRNTDVWEHSSLIRKAEALGDPLDAGWLSHPRGLDQHLLLERGQTAFPNKHKTKRGSASPLKLGQRTEAGGTDERPVNSVMLIGLPHDILLEEIVKVYTTPPIVSPPGTVMPATSSTTTVNHVPSSDSGPSMSSTVSHAINIHLPVIISIFERHPTLSPTHRCAVISFNSAEDYEAGICLLPPSMWYRPGTSGQPQGRFVKPDERDGTEHIFQCHYNSGDYTHLHVEGQATWRVTEDA
ncbi:hypothetical protein CALVIDRAFT_531358 [Calocera viscosa TUFC12733]|uniref:Uncharacterized protein n=1 Tax=Calocera viscosa (strain TUFC12733) TaxID=1330018 RepID=A0A167GI90_CALVF|nr:hypothetical protein CALVIDRAFT_531358 [Calocera viscosa TUFC12733]